MFKIWIEFETDVEFNGVAALDFARRHGLPDSSHLCLTDSGTLGSGIQQIEVDEAFARAWFSEDQSLSEVKIPTHLLAKGDLRMANENNSWAVTFADLSTERAKELYVAARFASCRAQVKRLKAEVAHLALNWRRPMKPDAELEELSAAGAAEVLAVFADEGAIDLDTISPTVIEMIAVSWRAGYRAAEGLTSPNRN